jgi:hypothetical protein
MSAGEIHHEFCAIYGQHVMIEGTVRQWCRMFEDERTNVHDEERSGRPPVVSEWSCSKFWPKFVRFTISEFFSKFSQISRTLLYEVIIVRLSYHKFCVTGVPKILTKRRGLLRLWPFRAKPQWWRWISHSNRTSNRWWNLGFICECWNQRTVKAVDADIFTVQAEKD